MLIQVNKIALVTGAGRGIGKSVAIAFLKAGYRVVLTGRHAETLEQTMQESGASEAEAFIVTADVTDPASVSRLFAKIEERFGRLDLLFNNAGIFPPAVPIDELPFEQWKAAVDVNLTGAFLCAQAAVKLMKKQSPRGGRIINNGSIAAYTPRPNSAPYTATKHAITGLTKCLALDGRAFDIACSQIDIGNALTDMTRVVTKGVRQCNGAIAKEPVMDLEHVASSVLHIANLPLDANVLFMTLMATNMPYVGRG